MVRPYLFIELGNRGAWSEAGPASLLPGGPYRATEVRGAPTWPNGGFGRITSKWGRFGVG